MPNITLKTKNKKTKKSDILFGEKYETTLSIIILIRSSESSNFN